MKLLPLSHSQDMCGCRAIGLRYKDNTSGTPAGGRAPLTTVQHGAIRDGFTKIAGGVIPGEAGDRAIGKAITDMDTIDTGMGTVTDTAVSLAPPRHAVVANVLCRMISRICAEHQREGPPS
jgi:hypothetical protein